MIKLYGSPDTDPALLDAVVKLLGERNATIAMFPRQPINAKACQHPGRLRFEVVIDGKAFAAYQHLDGSIELPNL